MKRTVLALISLSLALVVTLFIAASIGVAQAGQPVRDARPTPTPDGHPPVIPQPVGPEAPEVPPLPDLVVESIEVVPARPLLNVPAVIKVKIANHGSTDLPLDNNFYTDLYIDPGVVPIELKQDGVFSWGCQYWWVPAGGSHVLTTTWTFGDVRPHSVYAQVDTDGTVEEEREYNNVLGPVWVASRSPAMIVHQTHEDFQLGMASSMDLSHPDGVMRRGVFLQPSTEPDVYETDSPVNNPNIINNPETGMRQINPALAGTGNGDWLFAVWEDGRDGGAYNRRLYSRRSSNQGETWSGEVLVDPSVPTSQSVNQLNPDLLYDSGYLYAVWQDNRLGVDNYDIYFARSDNQGATWSLIRNLNQLNEPGTANQTHPSIAVGPSGSIYVVWQDARNGNQDVYLARSDDNGNTWSDNYFVTDDPDWTWANQSSPSVAVQDALVGGTLEDAVYVAWEDWRNLTHPEVYVAMSKDLGETFGVDVPVTVPGGSSYRVEPTIKVGLYVSGTLPQPDVFMHDIHVAWQQGEGEEADIYWAYANRDYVEPYFCPWPNDICFEAPQKVNGYVLDSYYVQPEDPGPTWPIDPTWQGQVSIALAMPEDGTFCVPDDDEFYSRGLYLVWSDSRSYDAWRFELHTRRIASLEGYGDYVLCESMADLGTGDSGTGVNPDNAKLYNYRDDLGTYAYYEPAATMQSNPYIHRGWYNNQPLVYVLWDDDRWDVPSVPGQVPNRDIFGARMGIADEAVYISPVIDAAKTSAWYVLSWYAATEHSDEVLFQTRFGAEGAGVPPENGAAGNGWTAWTGNPSESYPDPPFNGCDAGPGCYYDAPGREIVGPGGATEPQYRYIQYKAIIRVAEGADMEHPFKTAISQVKIYFEGPDSIYLPFIVKTP